MHTYKWILVAIGVLAHSAMAQDVPWHYDFEEASLSPAYRATAGSRIAVSTRHYKMGRQALVWTWQNGDRLLFTDPAPGRSTALTAFRAWVYLEQASADSTLTFRFGTESELATNNPRYQFEFGMNFTGWRAMWVDLPRDATRAAYTGPNAGRVTAFDIVAPNNTGSAYLDLMEMVDSRSVRRAMADVQVPFVNGGAVNNRELRWSLNTLPGASVPAAITQAQRNAFATIANRYETWILGNNVKADMREPIQIRLDSLTSFIELGHRNFERFNVTRTSDGRILGTPLFSSRAPYSPYFNEIFQGMLLYLALDFRLNNNQQAKDRVLDIFDYLNDQGWAAGSSIGTIYHEFLRVSGYANSVYLMRDTLRARGMLARELQTIEWHSMFGEIYDASWDPGTNADFLRSVSLFRLLLILMLEDTPEKVAKMQHFLRWLNNAIDIAPGWLDTIKPDYTSFHHRGIYANAYGQNAIHMGALLVYLLHDTPFAVADAGRDNVKNALLTSRTMANTYDISTAIGGRFPFSTTIANRLLPAQMYVAMSYTPVDAELSGAFMHLWRPESPVLKVELFPRVSVRIMYLDSPGAMQMMADFAARGYAADPVSGHWTMPYGALSIHRRDEWMVSMKGWSKYVWDFESDGNLNRLGRYLSYGSMLIYATGDPAGRAASGIVEAGWDWNMWPGTTVIRLNETELATWDRDRNFSDETFVGGVNLEGENGVFALKLHDTQHNTSFRGIKTTFCFDEVLVCLGSGITNNDSGHETVTTLFQNATSANRATVIDGEGMFSLPYSFSGTAGQGVWLMDSSGNGYVLPNGNGLQVRRTQNESGVFELAWIDHGNMPADSTYHYAVLVQQPQGRVRKFATAPEYVVLQRDNQAHIVHYPKMKTTGYAMIDAAARPTQGEIVQVDLPVLAMTRETEEGLLLSVADPNYGWDWIIQTPHRQSATLVVNQSTTPRAVTVTMRGQWRLDGMHALASVTSVHANPDRTTVALTCQDGKTVQVKLIRTSVGVAQLDFNSDNVIDIDDFLLFISKFGLTTGDPGFESKYDLDSNDIVGFSDFVLFAEGFGKQVPSSKPVAIRPLPGWSDS